MRLSPACYAQSTLPSYMKTPKRPWNYGGFELKASFKHKRLLNHTQMPPWYLNQDGIHDDGFVRLLAKVIWA
jgi:hypothetical protein